jgi:hypothetical protein
LAIEASFLNGTLATRRVAAATRPLSRMRGNCA